MENILNSGSLFRGFLPLTIVGALIAGSEDSSASPVLPPQSSESTSARGGREVPCAGRRSAPVERSRAPRRRPHNHLPRNRPSEWRAPVLSPAPAAAFPIPPCSAARSAAAAGCRHETGLRQRRYYPPRRAASG